MQRQIIVWSERLLFRKTFVKLLRVLNPEFDIVECTDSVQNPQAIACQAHGILLADCGSLDEAAILNCVLHSLSEEPEAEVVVVLDEQDDECIDCAMQAGAAGVLIKAAPPQVLVEMVQRILDGERCRPAPATTVVREEIPEAMRKQLSAREQKMLRLIMGGHSVSATARQLSLTPAKVVREMRGVLGVIRGRSFT